MAESADGENMFGCWIETKMEQMYALTLIELINDELNKSFLR